MVLSVSLITGASTTYLADSATCESALGEVLNACPPPTTDGETLVKYGGEVVREGGDGSRALWGIELKRVSAIS